MPFGCALGIRALHRRRLSGPLLVPLFLVWLGFLPNAPYLVTDFVSLRTCAHVVRVRAGSLAVLAFTPLVALATGFGIYLGRFLRLRTWDVATKPGTVLVQTLSPLVDPLGHVHAWSFER